MAEAKKCDRCGIYYSKDAEKVIRERDEFYVMPRTSNKRKDLCIACSRQLQIFMNEIKEQTTLNEQEAN